MRIRGKWEPCTNQPNNVHILKRYLWEVLETNPMQTTSMIYARSSCYNTLYFVIVKLWVIKLRLKFISNLKICKFSQLVWGNIWTSHSKYIIYVPINATYVDLGFKMFFITQIQLRSQFPLINVSLGKWDRGKWELVI